MDSRIVTGTYTGTGAAINIELGFVPVMFDVWNETDGDAFWRWISGMDDGTAMSIAAATAALASNGVTPYEGSVGDDSKGVTVGTTLSESAKVHRYVAYRGN